MDKELTKEEIDKELKYEDDCGVNTLLQDLALDVWKGKKIGVFKNAKGECYVKEKEEIKIMSKEKMEKLVAEHKILLNKVKKKFDVDDERAEQAIDIACDFNIQNGEDLMETLMVIIHTIKRIED